MKSHLRITLALQLKTTAKLSKERAFSTTKRVIMQIAEAESNLQNFFCLPAFVYSQDSQRGARKTAVIYLGIQIYQIFYPAKIYPLDTMSFFLLWIK